MLESMVTGPVACLDTITIVASPGAGALDGVNPESRATEFREVPATVISRKRDGDEDSTEETIIVD